jgi:predicted nucleic-acid-binding protein
MRAVDTNVIVRLIARDNQKQTDSAEAFIADGAWVPSLVLAESVWVLEAVYGLRKSQISKAIAMLLEHQQLVLQDSNAVRAALNEYETYKGVGFTDCLVVAIVNQHGHTPVGTFDKKMARITGAEGI